MIHIDPINTSSKLPPLIYTTLEERSGYHQRFFYIFIVATSVFLMVFPIVIWELRNEEIGLQLFLDLLWLVFPGICGYLIFHHRKRKEVLDDCLRHGEFSIIRGTLDGIQRLRWKRVRYIIDGRAIDGTLVFSGFTAFQNTRVIDVVTTYGHAVQLYLLPNGLIAGAIYPELDSNWTSRPVTSKDWQFIAQLQRGGVKLFAWSALFMSLLVVGICWFLERETGGGWEIMAEMLLIFNGVNLLLTAVQLLINWTQLRALTDKYHPSVQVRVYQGLSAEWYLTGTRYGRPSSPTTFHGWIRLSGALHQIQFDDSFSPNSDFLEPLKKQMKLEYLVYKGRLVFLRSNLNTPNS